MKRSDTITREKTERGKRERKEEKKIDRLNRSPVDVYLKGSLSIRSAKIINYQNVSEKLYLEILLVPITILV